MKLLKLLVPAFLFSYTLDVKANPVTVSNSQDKNALSSYVLSLYSSQSKHSLLIREDYIVFSEWIYDAIIATGDDCTLVCEYNSNVATTLNLSATLYDNLGKLYNFQEDKGYSNYGSYQAWRAAFFEGRSDTQLIDHINSWVKSITLDTNDPHDHILTLTYTHEDPTSTYSNSYVSIHYNPESGHVISVNDNVYYESFKYVSTLTFDLDAGIYIFNVKDYTCKANGGGLNKCIVTNGVNSSDLILHTDISINVNSSTSNISSYEGKMYYTENLNSYWAGQNQIINILQRSGASVANTDYVDISTLFQ